MYLWMKRLELLRAHFFLIQEPANGSIPISTGIQMLNVIMRLLLGKVDGLPHQYILLTLKRLIL